MCCFLFEICWLLIVVVVDNVVLFVLVLVLVLFLVLVLVLVLS